MECAIRRTPAAPVLTGRGDDPAWAAAEILEVALFHPASSSHRPRTQARLLYDDQGIYVHFHVQDRYVLSTRTAHHDNVCRDACVEFFVAPAPGKGYFNIETNCGGAVLLHYTPLTGRVNGNGRHFAAIDDTWIQRMNLRHTLPKVVQPEMVEPTEWSLEYFLPFALFEAYLGHGQLQPRPGKEQGPATWRANFYKCASDCSHPHWASWAPIGEQLNFHQPETFQTLRFE